MVELRLLAPAEIQSWEGQLWPYIWQVCELSRGRYEAKHFLKWAIDGEWQIWLALEDHAIRAICGTEIIVFPTGKKAIAFRFCTGSERDQWEHYVDDILAWGKARGCTLSEGIFRKGWGRALPGWVHGHDFLERPL